MTTNKKLIVFTHGGGRFANQLISYGHLIGFLAEKNYDFDLINLAFWEYAHLLEETSDNFLCTMPTQHSKGQLLAIIKFVCYPLFKSNSKQAKYRKILNNLIRRNAIRGLYAIGYITPNMQTIIAKNATSLNGCLAKQLDSLNLGNVEDINLLNRANVTILAGWGIKSWSLFKKHQIKIRSSLSLKSEYLGIGEKFVQSLRNEYNFLIGVLIRQDDYRIFAGGKYFFETDRYIEWIKQAKELFVLSGKVGFIIASDEPQDIDKFGNLNVHFATGKAVGKGHYLENMAELSKCDLIMTPPSTFGVWAAFIGDIPILPLYKNSQVISKEDLLENHIYDAIAHPHLSIAVS